MQCTPAVCGNNIKLLADPSLSIKWKQRPGQELFQDRPGAAGKQKYYGLIYTNFNEEVLTFTPGPMEVVTATPLMYVPLAAAGFAF